jgi:hypothetical protein
MRIDSKFLGCNLARMSGRFAPEAALSEIEIQLPLYPRKLTQF